MTSQMSMPMRSASIASSLTSAMLTERKMFSSSFASSAVSGEPTGTTRSQTRLVDLGGALGAGRRQAADDLRRRADRVVGPARVDALGREREREVRAGAQAGLLQQRDQVARAWCRGTWSTRARSAAPRRITPPSARPALSSGPSSGSRLAFSGVGTQIRIASASCSSTSRVVKRQRSSAPASRASGTSSMWERPSRSAATLCASTSIPMTSLARVGELHRQRQADVAEADDPDAHAVLRRRGTSEPRMRRRSSRWVKRWYSRSGTRSTRRAAARKYP